MAAGIVLCLFAVHESISTATAKRRRKKRKLTSCPSADLILSFSNFDRAFIFTHYVFMDAHKTVWCLHFAQLLLLCCFFTSFGQSFITSDASHTKYGKFSMYSDRTDYTVCFNLLICCCLFSLFSFTLCSCQWIIYVQPRKKNHTSTMWCSKRVKSEKRKPTQKIINFSFIRCVYMELWRLRYFRMFKRVFHFVTRSLFFSQNRIHFGFGIFKKKINQAINAQLCLFVVTFFLHSFIHSMKVFVWALLFAFNKFDSR